MAEGAEPQYWVRTEQGLVWGPYPRALLQRLRDRLGGKSDVSTDGKSYRPAGEYPELRGVLWDEEAQQAATAEVVTEPVAMAEQTAPITPSSPEILPASLPEESQLTAVSVVRLYAIAAASNATGWLQLTTPEGRLVQVSFRRGTPDHVSSDDPELGVLRFLMNRKAITAEQAMRVEEHRARVGTDAVSALFALQLVAPADAHRVLGEHMSYLLDRALSTWRGTSTFEADAPSPPGAYPLGGKWALLVEACRRMDPATVRARLGRRLQRRAMRSAGASIGKLEDLTLTAQEVRLYGGIDGTRTGEELLRSVPEAAVALRLLHLLSELGHVSFEEQQPGVGRASAPKPPPPPPTPTQTVAKVAAPAPAPSRIAPPVKVIPQPAPPPPAPRPPAAGRPAASPIVTPPPHKPKPRPPPAAGDELSALRATLATLEKQDHFTALGLTRKATAAEAKRAFFQLAREYHPDTVPESAPPEQRELKERLFSRVNEAAAVLGDEARRKAYEAELDGDGAVDVGNIFAAEDAFLRGEILIKAKKFPEALAAIDEAIKLHDGEGEFYAWRGWARFMVAKDRRVAWPESLADCKKALQMSPLCAPAWLFQAQMAKILGDLKTAEACFKKTLDLDPKNLEATRELRYLWPGKKS